MALITPLKEINVAGFHEFCSSFNIKSDKKAGINGYDQELIEEEIGKLKNEKWIVNFIENNRDGFFHLIQID